MQDVFSGSKFEIILFLRFVEMIELMLVCFLLDILELWLYYKMLCVTNIKRVWALLRRHIQYISTQHFCSRTLCREQLTVHLWNIGCLSIKSLVIISFCTSFISLLLAYITKPVKKFLNNTTKLQLRRI